MAPCYLFGVKPDLIVYALMIEILITLLTLVLQLLSVGSRDTVPASPLLSTHNILFHGCQSNVSPQN